MAAGLAHENRNPLAAMKLSVEVLLTELDMKERDRTVLLKVIEEIGRVERLMKNLLNFARPATAQLITVNVNKMLEETIKFLERHPSFSQYASLKKIVRDFDSYLPDTSSDPQQLQQIFLNIFLNAAEAMPGGGTVTVKTGSDTAPGTIFIEVSDTGNGIPAEAMEQIFKPFFTTKVKGTGLGLAVSRRLVEEHGGRIIAGNNADGGATFKVILPIRGKGEKI
jgi:signal transduction histidine kinase